MWGQTVALGWSMQLPAGCAVGTLIDFTDDATGLTYSEPSATTEQLTPPSSGSYHLMVYSNGFVYDEGSRHVSVAYPTIAGHPWARITPFIPDEAATFANIVQQPDARVFIQGDVNLDLSGMADIRVASGVQIIGERDASHPRGPRLFTTTFPDNLLKIGDPDAQTVVDGVTKFGSTADNVRITGVVFDGGEPDDPCASAGDSVPPSFAILVYASRHVEIDHSELFHWRGGGVKVVDNDDLTPDQLPSGQPHDAINQSSFASGVWIYDNYFHDNMHPTSCDILSGSGSGFGYGVVTGAGGFPYIQGNVFDKNRHAIAASGTDGSGYTAIGNLFLNPGINKERLGGLDIYYNHQIDMHGTMNCGDEGYDCGQGGLYMEVENNTVVGDTASGVQGVVDAAAIQLRGKPANVLAVPPMQPIPGLPPGFGMYVHDNTFNGPQGEELTETDPSFGLTVGSGNAFIPAGSAQLAFADAFYDPSSQGPSCDFDGDGTADAFRDSAGTFWYYSSRLGRWSYLGTNAATGNLSFADKNGDGLCDVTDAQGTTYLTPSAFESFPLNAAVPDLSGLPQAAAQDAIAAAGLQLDTVTQVVSLNPVGTVVGQSLGAGSTAQAGSLVALRVSVGGVVLPNLSGMSESAARAALANAGLVVGNVTYDMSPATPGTVDGQNPAAGTGGVFVIVAPGSTVDFGVSLGQVLVPNLMYESEAEASSDVGRAGLSVGHVSYLNDCANPGEVEVQDPSAGVRVAGGSSVNYTVSTCSGGGGSGGSGGSGGGGGGGHILPK